MYWLPSTSHTRAPLAFSTKNGCPPTARNARTGELTPPGMYFNASANKAADLACETTRRNYSWPAVSARKFRSIDSARARSYSGTMLDAKAPLITRHDYQAMPEGPPYFQVIEGELVMTPSPNLFHQDISGNVFTILRSYLARNPIGS